jgi:tetratricopeptide (TPR) repeat protein
MSFFRARLLSLTIVPMLLGVAPDAKPEAQPPELHRGVEYRGAAGFFFLGTMTVVYPAGAGEPVDLYRRSAEARARWIAAVYKGKVEVAADDQLTEEQRQGNLLLLGWNNRFFTPPGPARPFTHDQEGTSFLGLRENDKSLDLLVFHRNPLNWSAYILFWSRMDPERDRFFVLPRVGSDWAIYRNFATMRQGMFVPARVWPPARDKVAEADITKEVIVRPGGTATFDSEHYHEVYDRGQFKAADISAIAQAREAALSKAVAALGPAPDGFRVQLFVYPDEGAKLEATGVDDPTHAVPGSREIHAIRAYALSPSPREEIHVLAREVYGPCYLTAMYEGLALSIENSLRGDDMETHAAQLRSTNRLPDLADLLDEERFRVLPTEVGAAATAVFMTWLRQTYGPDALKKCYGLRDGTPRALAAALGTTEDQLTASFTTWADAKVAARRSDLDFRAAELEAQQRRTASDWSGMAVALRKALQAKPGDPQTLFNLASAQMREGDLAGAETSLKQILAARLPQSESRFRIFGHYQLGRVYDLAGRRAEALAQYDAVLALPDDHGAHALALERKSSPATREQLE